MMPAGDSRSRLSAPVYSPSIALIKLFTGYKEGATDSPLQIRPIFLFKNTIFLKYSKHSYPKQAHRYTTYIATPCAVILFPWVLEVVVNATSFQPAGPHR